MNIPVYLFCDSQRDTWPNSRSITCSVYCLCTLWGHMDPFVMEASKIMEYNIFLYVCVVCIGVYKKTNYILNKAYPNTDDITKFIVTLVHTFI